MNVQDKVAVVTGSASGIGRATVEAFAKAGAHVILADIAEEAGAAAAKEMADQGLSVKFAGMDVTDQASIDDAKKIALDWQGKVDIVANVAGWGKIEPFIDNTPEFWRQIVDLNLMGTIAVTRAFLDGMMERNYGKIINVSSDAGRSGSLGETVYAGAKGGVIAFGKSLARETARYNITVNSVCPGPTDTPLLAKVPEKHREAFIRVTPMRRLAKPEEVADAVLFFGSDRSSFITGQVISVSGGITMVG